MKRNFFKTLALACLLLFLGVISGLAQNPATSSAAVTGRERLSLDRGWLLHEGDVPFPVITGHQQSYNNAKAGSSWGAASPSFDDSSWKPVDLPHDWAVEQPFDKSANISQGYRARGMGWYRKYFRLDPADHGKHLEIQLDGIATHCTVWVNGVPPRATGAAIRRSILTSRRSRNLVRTSMSSPCRWTPSRKKVGGMKARGFTATPGS